MIIVKQNLLTFDGFITHQCNVTSKGSAGLAKQIFTKFPEANTYPANHKLGSISVHGRVINMYAQMFPGKPKNGLYNHDTHIERQTWFRQCLKEIERLEITKLAFPYGIGCGLAGGNWITYESMIFDFSERVAYEVYLCRL